MTDSLELLRDLAAGKREALEPLLDRHLPGLLAYVRLKTDRVVRAREGSVDLVQSVCREVLEHADRFQHPSEGAFRQWLYTTALRKIRNRYAYWHAQKRDVGHELPLGGPPSGSAGADPLSLAYAELGTPSRELMAREECEAVEAAFDRLPEDWREALVLARVVGLTRKEIAERLGRTEGAVRQLLFRAQSRLAELLAPPDPS